MLDSYERLQKIDQTLNEFFEFDGNKILKGFSYVSPLGHLIPKRFMSQKATDPSKKLQLTGDQGSAKMYVPDADTRARIAARQRQTELTLAARGARGDNSVAAQNARFQTNMRRGSKVAQGVAAGAALAAGAVAAAPAVAAAAAPAAQKLTLSAALRYGGGRALQAGAGRAATQTGIRATARGLGSKALGTVRKTALGRLMTGKFAQAVGREAAIYGALSKLGVFGGGDGGADGEAGVDDIGTKKLKPKSIGDLEATSAGRDFEAEYGGKSIKKLRGR